MHMPSMPELLLITLVMFLFFGANKLPEAAKSIGQSFKIFKQEINDIKEVSKVEVQSEVENASKL